MARKTVLLLALAGTAAGIAGAAIAQTAPGAQGWMKPTLAPEMRAEQLVAAMSLDQKIQQIAMDPKPNPGIPGCNMGRNARHIEGIPALGIPTVRMSNAPAGVVGGDCDPDPEATSLPDQLAATASWDRGLWSAWGDIVGEETRATAHTIVLTPGINLGRIPHNGRNFEYAGEDPFLAGSVAVDITRAIQKHGILATGKHYVGNEQETQRLTMNSVIDDRPLHELYLLPFEMAVKDADIATLMCSYPRINGTYSCEDPYTLDTVLRKSWGFKGFIMSDRGATNSTVASIKAGNDLEFASPKYFTKAAIEKALAEKQITVADLDAMLTRRFYTMFKFGQFERPVTGFSPIDFAGHGKSSREMAEQGSVLLKNAGGMLPLRAAAVRRVAIIGSETFAGKAVMGGNGPRQVTVRAKYSIAPPQGLRNTLAALGSTATVTYNDGKNTAAATALAAASDVVIVMAGDKSVEGRDRENLSLPIIDGVDQNVLIDAVAKANPKTVVVLKNGGPVLMPWLANVSAVLESWYPGQEDGNAVANLLFGVANPSGKLPITFPAVEREAAAATVSQWPGVPVNGILTATYSEGLKMGYRWYDANRRKPLFSFGHGLSYTTFNFSDLAVSKAGGEQGGVITVRFTVRNSGSVTGSEVPQVYIGLPSSTGEPPKRLVGFDKVTLKPGGRKVVTVTIDARATNHPLSIWDPSKSQWKTVSGTYQIMVGKASNDIVLKGAVKIGS